jgi:hypothetical protein
MDLKLMMNLSTEKLLQYKETYKGQPSVVSYIDGILEARNKAEADVETAIKADLDAKAEQDVYLDKTTKGIKTMPKPVPATVQNVFYRRAAIITKDKDGKDIEELGWAVELNHVCNCTKNKSGETESTSKGKNKLAVKVYEQITQPMLEANGKPKLDTEGKAVMQVIEKDLGEWASIRAFATSIGIENHGASARQDLANNTMKRQFRIQNLN